MALMTLGEVLGAVRRDPLAFLTSRRLGSLSHFLSGRDLALNHLGIGGWSDLPIVGRVEQHHGATTTPWRSWTDIVEFFALDEWDAFDKFLAFACGWNDPVPAPPTSFATPPPVATLLEQVARRPPMFLGKKSCLRLADFLRGYLCTLGASDDVQELERFCAKIPALCGDDTGRPWFRVLRFRIGSQGEAFDEFFRLWALERAATGR